MEPELVQKLLKRLDILISLKMSSKSWIDSVDQDRIAFLSRFGLEPAEMAEILNTTGDKISKQLWVIRQKKSKNGK